MFRTRIMQQKSFKPGFETADGFQVLEDRLTPSGSQIPSVEVVRVAILDSTSTSSVATPHVSNATMLSVGKMGAPSHGELVSRVFANDVEKFAGAQDHIVFSTIKVTDANGLSSADGFVRGIFEAEQNHANVIETSVRIPWESPEVVSAVNDAMARDIVFVAAAGNSVSDMKLPPGVSDAFSTHFLYVGAAERDGHLAEYSNFGQAVGIAASTPDGLDGTSFSAPDVAAVAAVYKAEHPFATGSQIVSQLKSTAIHFPSLGDKIESGVLDPSAALGRASEFHVAYESGERTQFEISSVDGTVRAMYQSLQVTSADEYGWFSKAFHAVKSVVVSVAKAAVTVEKAVVKEAVAVEKVVVKDVKAVAKVAVKLAENEVVDYAVTAIFASVGIPPVAVPFGETLVNDLIHGRTKLSQIFSDEVSLVKQTVKGAAVAVVADSVWSALSQHLPQVTTVSQMAGSAAPVFDLPPAAFDLASFPGSNSPSSSGDGMLIPAAYQGIVQPPTFANVGSVGKNGKDLYVVYKDEVRVGGDRSWRNNNPGNIKAGLQHDPNNHNHYTQFALPKGAIAQDRTKGQIDDPMAIFPDAATGTAAMKTMLQGAKYQNLSLAKAIEKWAPPSENNTAAYIAAVARQTGLNMATRMSKLTNQQLDSMIAAMRQVEGSHTHAGTVYKATDPNLPLWVRALLTSAKSV